MSTKIYCVTGSLEKICQMEATRHISAYMNLYPHFPGLLPHLGRIWYKESEHNAIRNYGLHENRCGKSHNFLTSVNKITLMCISTSFTVYPPHHYCYTHILHFDEAWRRFASTAASVMVVTSMGNLPLLYFLKISCYACYLFLIINHSRNIVGQDQELWMINVTKWHFKERCIQYNTLFILEIFIYQRE